MTTHPPFDALRTRLREARAQGRLITPPTLAKPRFHVAAEVVLGPVLRHAAHVLWLEGVPATMVSELDADPPYIAVRLDHHLGVGIYFWTGTDPNTILWAIHSGDGYGDTQTVPYDFLSPARVASLLEQVIGSLLGLPEAGTPFAQQANTAPTATGGTGQQPVAA